MCLFVRDFLGYSETDWDTLWHKVAFWPWEGSKTIIFFKNAFYCRVIAIFYISLRFLCKYEGRLQKKTKQKKTNKKTKKQKNKQTKK